MGLMRSSWNFLNSFSTIRSSIASYLRSSPPAVDMPLWFYPFVCTPVLPASYYFCPFGFVAVFVSVTHLRIRSLFCQTQQEERKEYVYLSINPSRQSPVSLPLTLLFSPLTAGILIACLTTLVDSSAPQQFQLMANQPSPLPSCLHGRPDQNRPFTLQSYAPP